MNVKVPSIIRKVALICIIAFPSYLLQGASMVSDTCISSDLPIILKEGVESILPSGPCDKNGSISISAGSIEEKTLEYSIDGGMLWQESGSFSNLGNGSYNILVRISGDTCTVAYNNNPLVINTGECFVHINGQVRANNLPSDETLDNVVFIDDGGTVVYKEVDNFIGSIEPNQFLEFQSNYTDLGIGYARASFYKNRDRVYLGGSVKTVSGRPADGNIIGILPPGYRPTNRILTHGRQQSNTVRIDILTTGEVVLQSGANNSSNFVSLEGISFRMEPYAIGDIVGGGTLFYIAAEGEDLNGDGVADRGLVASLGEVGGAFGWGCNGLDISDADEFAIGAGYQNTMAIVSNCIGPSTTSAFAANLAANWNSYNYRDWFLPSQFELLEMIRNIEGFSEDRYWSSSQSGPSIGMYGSKNGSNGASKNRLYKVRPIRVF